jgi:hypothetical protein
MYNMLPSLLFIYSIHTFDGPLYIIYITPFWEKEKGKNYKRCRNVTQEAAFAILSGGARIFVPCTL